MKNIILLVALLFNYTFAFDFGKLAGDLLEDVKKEVTTQTSSSTTSLSEETISKGLKEALNKGVKLAISSLGAKNGYLNNEEVKIPLPASLEKAKILISSIGAESYIKDLEKAMNDAATQAAPQTAEIFAASISKITIDDATSILEGENNAATTYFKKNTLTSLKDLITPIIKKAIDDNNVATYYKSFNSFYKQNVKSYVESSSIMSYAKTLGVDSYIPSEQEEDLDEFIVNKALDGLFLMIEKEEKAIRENPIQRTTQLLKDVFSN